MDEHTPENPDGQTGESLPFRATTSPAETVSNEDREDWGEEELSMEDIDAAYQLALAAADAVEMQLPEELREDSHENEEDDPLPKQGNAPHHTGKETNDTELETDGSETTLTPIEILEAVLFVGGQPMKTKQLRDLLGGSFDHERVDQLLGELGDRYASEGRPYELHFGEGGYSLALRPEFEAVRRKVFNQGPKDVKLSQDALEVLAFVAYQQPVTKADVEATEKQNAVSCLRQLLRRQLVELNREDGQQTYTTTARFLDLFGLASLDDLPQAIDFQFK
ncbi:MAG: SMC-Scp complex subunit ScpB [Planctomycetaceae bacterium]|nr:SMC-Scp complex subunit ScpB [Planctomycetaceae bacterium]